MMHRYEKPQGPRLRLFDHRFHCAPEQLEALEDGEMSRTQERRVLRHLNSCEVCRRERARIHSALGDTWAALEQYPRIVAPPGFDAAVWAEIESRQSQRMAAPPLERLSHILLHPIPRLLGSAMFGLLAALAFGHVAASLPVQPQLTAIAALSSPDNAQASLYVLYAVEQRRYSYWGETPAQPQVLVPIPEAAEPQSAPQRRSQENISWPNLPRLSRAASSGDAGSWC